MIRLLFLLALLCLAMLSGCGAADVPGGGLRAPEPAPISAREPDTRRVLRYGRSLLGEKERAAYDQIARTLQGWRVAETIPLDQKLSVERFNKAWNALQNDWPEFYWAECAVTEKGGLAAALTINPANGMSIDEVKQRQQEIDKAADRLVAGIGGSAFQVVANIHDVVLRQITYEQGTKDADSGTLYGGLVLGRGACDAYSKTFQYLLQKKGISTCYIRGTSIRNIPHSWNAVLLEDGWYYADLTWDDVPDEKGYLFHDYLLVTAEEIALDHFPEAGQYDRLPEAAADRGNYYRMKGYYAEPGAGGSPTEAMAAGFARQLAEQELAQAKRPVFLELKVLGTYEEYLVYRDLFEKQIHTVLRAVETALIQEGIPVSIDTTGLIEYNYNDNTQVLTLFPNASAS